ncbi:MAG: DUF4838 domain-containing protein [Phycisphaerae bacterium]|nr:DUF4838 domain-containing protein [Phycisphaerae bacterium]
MTLRALTSAIVPLWIAAVAIIAPAAEPVVPVAIVASPGGFATVEAAATAEEQVDFWDADPTDDRACTECFAAVELRRFLAACTDLADEKIVLTSPTTMPAAAHVFVLGSGGSNPLLATLDAPASKHPAPTAPESFRIQTFQKDGRLITVIEGADRVGTLYGVYAYLNRIGMRFFGLGEQGTAWPAAPVELPAELDVAEAPAFLSRGFWAWEDRGDEEFFLWMARNRLNLWTAAERPLGLLKKLGLKLTEGQHDIQKRFLDPQAAYPYNHPRFDGDEDKPDDPYAVSSEYLGDANDNGTLTYYEAHPEWYGLRKGKRADRFTGEDGQGGVNYCTSNRDATLELAKNLTQDLIDGQWRHADTLNFWMLDAMPWCECDACKRQGTLTDRLMETVHVVLTELNKARQTGRLLREIELITLAYHETLDPPSKPLPPDFDFAHCSVTFFPIERCFAHSLADPACTEINRRLADNLRGWTVGEGRHYTGPVFIGEYYNVSSLKSLPVVFPTIMAADIPWYYRIGARHFHYMHTPTRLWGTWTLNQYLMARLLWDPDADSTTIIDEFFREYYPTATDHMRSFYRHLEVASANCKAFKHYVEPRYALRNRLTGEQEIFPLDHLRYGAHRPPINDGPDVVEIIDAMKAARTEIDAALLECANPVEQARILEDERRFAYGETTYEFMYHLVRTALAHRRGDAATARREMLYAARCAELLESIVELVQVSSSHANAKNGLEASQAIGPYEHFRRLYGPEAGQEP